MMARLVVVLQPHIAARPSPMTAGPCWSCSPSRPSCSSASCSAVRRSTRPGPRRPPMRPRPPGWPPTRSCSSVPATTCAACAPRSPTGGPRAARRWWSSTAAGSPRPSATHCAPMSATAVTPILAGTAAGTLGGDASLPRRAGKTAPVVRRVGRGTTILVPDAEPLRNRSLAEGDHAAEALAIAGPPARRVAFVESVHGYREETGLAALPDRVQTCLLASRPRRARLPDRLRPAPRAARSRGPYPAATAASAC